MKTYIALIAIVPILAFALVGATEAEKPRPHCLVNKSFWECPIANYEDHICYCPTRDQLVGRDLQNYKWGTFTADGEKLLPCCKQPKEHTK